MTLKKKNNSPRKVFLEQVGGCGSLMNYNSGVRSLGGKNSVLVLYIFVVRQFFFSFFGDSILD